MVVDFCGESARNGNINENVYCIITDGEQKVGVQN